MKGERQDTEKGRGAEEEERGKEREEARERKGENQEKAMGQDDWGRG